VLRIVDCRGPLLALALGLASMTAAGNTPDPKSSASFYVETYGLVDAEQEPLVSNAVAVFDRVLQVADRKSNRNPGLRIVNSDGRPWAIALPDGYIILSRGALKVCFEGVSVDEGEARLAFILGHELAHLSSNDFWHREVYLSLSGETDQKSIANLRTSIGEAAADLVRQRELAADDIGFLYSTLAGFDTAAILGGGGGQDFFAHWIQQTRTNDEVGLIEAQQRTDFLRSRFATLASRTEVFNFGVRLAHFGRYRDSINFFKDFQRSFPSREVFNNIGYAHLQLARQQMPRDLSQRYWLPMELDHSTRLVAQTRSLQGSGVLPDNARRELTKAVEFLALAVQADVLHLPSRLNLVAAHMYLGEFHKARAVIEEARKIAPEDADVLGLRALVLYEQEREIDMFPVATTILAQLAQKPDSPLHVMFNLARLYEGRGRIEQAERFWNELAAQSAALPLSWRAVVCKSVPESARCSSGDERSRGDRPRVNAAVAPGDSTDAGRTRKRLEDYEHTAANFGAIDADIFVGKRGSVLALDQNVEVVVSKGSGIDQVDQLENCCGQPVSKITTSIGEVWTFANDWAALIQGNEVRELWLVAD